jgi:hypothetical protein
MSYVHFTGKLLLDDFSNKGYSINYYGAAEAYDCLTSGGGSSGWQLQNSCSVNCTNIEDPIDPPIPPDPGGGGGPLQVFRISQIN